MEKNAAVLLGGLATAGLASAAAYVLYSFATGKSSAKSSGIKLTYFNLHGAAEPTRLALALTRTPFVDDRLTQERWKEVKPLMKYGQVPMMSREGKQYYQSSAMLRWVGSYCGDGSLYPVFDDAETTYQIDEMLGLCDDLERAWSPCRYVAMRPTTFGHPDDWPMNEKAATVKRLRERFVEDEEAFPRFLTYFTERLQEAPFLCGSLPTIADCRLLPQLRYFTLGKADHVPTTVLDDYPAIVAWVDRMMALPEIKAWYDVEGH